MTSIITLRPLFRKQTFLLLWILLISIAIYYFAKIWVPLRYYPDLIKEFISSFWVLWPIVYILVYTVRPLIFFPATLLTIASWLIFGPVLWVLYTIVWSNLSANVSYLAWKYFWEDFMAKITAKTKMLRFTDCRFKDNWFVAVLTMRLIFFPFDLVWYMSWICNIRQRDFALWTFIWILPWLITFVVLWASFTDPRNLITAWVFFVAWLWISKYLKKKNIWKLNN